VGGTRVSGATSNVPGLAGRCQIGGRAKSRRRVNRKFATAPSASKLRRTPNVRRLLKELVNFLPTQSRMFQAGALNQAIVQVAG
jgi:hypothetical protein